jgi:hypothetical protein
MVAYVEGMAYPYEIIWMNSYLNLEVKMKKI